MFFLSKAARPARYALFSGFAVRALGGLDPSVLLIAADLDVFGCLEVRTPTSLHLMRYMFSAGVDVAIMRRLAMFLSSCMCSDRGVGCFKIHGLFFGV